MFGTTANTHGSGVNPVVVADKKDDHGYGNPLWAIVIVIVFLIVVFAFFAMMFRGKDGEIRTNNGTNYAEAMMPFLAMSQMPKYGYDGGHQHWDMAINECNQFGNLKFQIAETGWKQSSENAKYFYEQQKTNLLGFKDVEIQGLKNTAEVVAAVKAEGDKRRDDELRRFEIRTAMQEAVSELRQKPIMPSFPVAPPAPYGYCGGGYAYSE
jgi:hypothetical protein